MLGWRALSVAFSALWQGLLGTGCLRVLNSMWSCSYQVALDRVTLACVCSECLML